jgi:hypothetical protein
MLGTGHSVLPLRREQRLRPKQIKPAEHLVDRHSVGFPVLQQFLLSSPYASEWRRSIDHCLHIGFVSSRSIRNRRGLLTL